MKTSATGSIIGPTLGNGIAYFILWYLANKQGIKFDDPEMALVFAGGIVGSLLLQVRKLGAMIKYVFDRVLPPKPPAP